MKNLILSFLFLLLSSSAFCQDDSVMRIFQEQIKAFNEHDVERMTELVSDNMVYYYVLADSLVREVKGKEEFNEAMKGYFSGILDVETSIIESFQHGEMVSFKEEVSWGEKEDRKTSRSIGVYQIKEEKIYRAWYFIQE